MSLKSGRAAPNKKDCTVFVVREDIEIKCMQGQQVGVVCDTRDTISSRSWCVRC